MHVRIENLTFAHQFRTIFQPDDPTHRLCRVAVITDRACWIPAIVTIDVRQEHAIGYYSHTEGISSCGTPEQTHAKAVEYAKHVLDLPNLYLFAEYG